MKDETRTQTLELIESLKRQIVALEQLPGRDLEILSCHEAIEKLQQLLESPMQNKGTAASR